MNRKFIITFILAAVLAAVSGAAFAQETSKSKYPIPVDLTPVSPKKDMAVVWFSNTFNNSPWLPIYARAIVKKYFKDK